MTTSNSTLANRLGAGGKGCGPDDIAAFRVGEIGLGKIAEVVGQQIPGSTLLPNFTERQGRIKLVDFVEGVVDRPVGQGGDQHPVAVSHQHAGQVRQHESFSGSWRPLDQVGQVGGIGVRQGFALGVVQPFGLSSFPGAFVAGVIDIGGQFTGYQRQNEFPPAQGIADLIEGIEEHAAQIEHTLIGNPAAGDVL